MNIQYRIGVLYRSFRNAGILKKLLLVFVVTILIPMLVINYISYKSSSKLIETEIINSISVISEQLNSLIEGRLKEIDRISSFMYSSPLSDIIVKKAYAPNSPELLDDNIEFEKFFNYTLSQSSYLESIYVFTSTGNTFHKSGIKQMDLHYNPTNQPWFDKTINSGKNIVTFGVHTPWPLSNTSHAVVSMSRAIRDIKGNILAVVLIDLNLATVRDLVKNLMVNRDSFIIITDDSLNTIYNNETTSARVKFNDKAVLKLISSQKNNQVMNFQNTDVFVTHYTSKVSGWKVISITPLSAINSRIGSMRKTNIIITLLSTIVYSLLLVVFYLTIFKPIHKLSKCMKEVESGNLNIRTEVSSKDEIGQLSGNFNNMLDKIYQLIESEYKANLVRKEAQFKALQAQINPHFLYNTLQLISSMAVVHKVTPVNKVVKALGYMLRYAIKTENDLVPFEKELQHVKSYIEIQKARLEDNVEITLDIDERLFQCSIMKLTIQPFIENAFNHGIENIRTKGIINLYAYLRNDVILINITDNGIGICSEKLALLKESLGDGEYQEVLKTSEASIGIQNVNARLKLFYGGNYYLGINSSYGEGTEVNIVIPTVSL